MHQVGPPDYESGSSNQTVSPIPVRASVRHPDRTESMPRYVSIQRRRLKGQSVCGRPETENLL